MASIRRLVVSAWKFTQVKLHGSYSSGRVESLEKYVHETSWAHAVGVLLLTPIPCLAVTLLGDVLPLSDPSEGIQANKLLFVREFYNTFVLAFVVVHQFREGVRLLPYPAQRVIRDCIIIALVTTAAYYWLVLTVGFPLPFSALLVCPPWATALLICIAIQWAAKIRDTPGAGAMLVGMVKLWMCDVLIVSIYPPYVYLFTTLSGNWQVAFALLLPMIKLFVRNLFARAAAHLGDETPELVVFNADVSGSLFVAYCMQSLPSVWVTLGIMVADIIMMAMSLRDIELTRSELVELERKLADELNNDTRVSTTLALASAIFHQDASPNFTPVTISAAPKRDPNVARARSKNNVLTTVLAPSSSPQLSKNRVHPVEAVGSQSQKQIYTRKVCQLLYMVEFLLLSNYVETIIPLVFGIYLVATYHLPNREYYTVFDGMDQSKLVRTLNNVLFYCALQFASLLALMFMLKRMLGHLPVQHIAFVLENQVHWVQMSLVFWLFYNVQGSLKHFGYDYTFQFAWLSESTNSTAEQRDSS